MNDKEQNNNSNNINEGSSEVRGDPPYQKRPDEPQNASPDTNSGDQDSGKVWTPFDLPLDQFKSQRPKPHFSRSRKTSEGNAGAEGFEEKGFDERSLREKEQAQHRNESAEDDEPAKQDDVKQDEAESEENDAKEHAPRDEGSDDFDIPDFVESDSPEEAELEMAEEDEDLDEPPSFPTAPLDMEAEDDLYAEDEQGSAGTGRATDEALATSSADEVSPQGTKMSTQDIDLTAPLQASAEGEAEPWAPDLEPEDSEAKLVEDETEAEKEAASRPEPQKSTKTPPDAERLRRRLEKYPEALPGKKKQKFHFDLNRASHRRGLAFGSVLAIVLVILIVVLVNNGRRERAAHQVAVEKQILTLDMSTGNAPDEQTLQHSDGKRIVNVALPYLGDPQFDQYVQVWARKKINDFEMQTNLLPSNLPDRRPILALSHKTNIVEDELASVELIAETYRSSADLNEGKVQSSDRQQFFYDKNYRTFLGVSDIFKADAETALADLGNKKIQAGEFEYQTPLAPVAYAELVEAEKAANEDQEQKENKEGKAKEDAVEAEADADLQANSVFALNVLHAEAEADAGAGEAGEAADDGIAREYMKEDEQAAAGNENPAAAPADGAAEDAAQDAAQDEAKDAVPVETTTTGDEPKDEQKDEQQGDKKDDKKEEQNDELDKVYKNVVLEPTPLLYKHMSFTDEGLDLELDAALLPENATPIVLHYNYDEILDLLRFEARAEGGYRLNLRIDPLGDTHRTYEAQLIEALYGTVPEDLSPVNTNQSAKPSENPAEAEDEQAADPNAEPVDENADGDAEEEPNLFLPKTLLAERHEVSPEKPDNPKDASPVGQAQDPEANANANPNANAEADAAAAEPNEAEQKQPADGEGEKTEADAKDTGDKKDKSNLEPTISPKLNRAGEFPQTGLSLTDHFATHKATYGQEIRYVAFTFNNSPQAETTQPLLDLLKAYRGKGTFFVRGVNAQNDGAGDLIKLIDSYDCEIGNNGFNLFEFPLLSDSDIGLEINDTADLIEQLSGVRPEIVRPPSGSYNDRVLAAGNAPFVTWSFASGDAAGAEADEVVATINEYIEPGSIVLCHEGYETTLEALQQSLPDLYSKGYRFVTVTDLFKIYSQNGLQSGSIYNSAWS